MIVPSGANESILNSKMSCSVITSASMRWTSVIAVTRREPSSSRSRWTIRSSAEATCSRIARTGRSKPAISTIVSMRASASRGALAWTVRERAVVAGVHRLEHVERLGAADLADDDAVGAHAQRVADEVADRDLALALDVRRARLEPEHVPLCSWSSAASSIVTMRSSSGIDGGQRVEQRRLAGAGAAGDEDVQLRLDAALRGSRPTPSVSVPRRTRSLQVEPLASRTCGS